MEHTTNACLNTAALMEGRMSKWIEDGNLLDHVWPCAGWRAACNAHKTQEQGTRTLFCKNKSKSFLQ
eukprot:347924-Chlamydomonas_euryale.AAC.2